MLFWDWSQVGTVSNSPCVRRFHHFPGDLSLPVDEAQTQKKKWSKPANNRTQQMLAEMWTNRSGEERAGHENQTHLVAFVSPFSLQRARNVSRLRPTQQLRGTRVSYIFGFYLDDSLIPSRLDHLGLPANRKAHVVTHSNWIFTFCISFELVFLMISWKCTAGNSNMTQEGQSCLGGGFTFIPLYPTGPGSPTLPCNAAARTDSWSRWRWVSLLKSEETMWCHGRVKDGMAKGHLPLHRCLLSLPAFRVCPFLPVERSDKNIIQNVVSDVPHSASIAALPSAAPSQAVSFFPRWGFGSFSLPSSEWRSGDVVNTFQLWACEALWDRLWLTTFEINVTWLDCHSKEGCRTLMFFFFNNLP